MTGLKKRVLIVEDDTGIARLLRDNLLYDGFDVEWSQTGRDAISIAKRFAPDLVLLDLMLPDGMDGLDLCRIFTRGSERKEKFSQRFAPCGKPISHTVMRAVDRAAAKSFIRVRRVSVETVKEL